MANLALFDFDHTLYKKDSLLEFTKFYVDRKYYTGILLLSPWLIALKLGFLNNEKVKLKYFNHFFGNLNYNDFCGVGETFAKRNIPENLDEKIFKKFEQHLKSGDSVYIVTASAAEWIQPWSKQFDVPVIGTKLQVQNGLLTGKFDSKNCYGLEKVNRIKEIINLEDFDSIFVYGSGIGDFEMLKLQSD